MGEIDIALRHLATQHSATLAATYVDVGQEVEVNGPRSSGGLCPQCREPCER